MTKKTKMTMSWKGRMLRTRNRSFWYVSFDDCDERTSSARLILSWLDVCGCQSHTPPPPDVLFGANDGFDVYVDGARYLPTNVIASKVSIKVMDHQYTQIGPVVETVSVLDSVARCPKFASLLECRTSDCSPTATIIVRIDALSEHSPDVEVQ